jgi:hypothetical protein
MSTPGYRVIEWHRRYFKQDGAWYREALAVRLADGQRRIIGVLDPELTA